jgi:hypothetical protein
MLIMTNSSNGEGIYQELLETALKNNYTPIEWESFTPYASAAPPATIPAHHEIALAAPQLARFVGSYRTDPTVLLTVTLENEQLFLQENDSNKHQLFAEGDRQFFLKDFDLQLAFELDAEGRASAVTVSLKGRSFHVQRLN